MWEKDWAAGKLAKALEDEVIPRGETDVGRKLQIASDCRGGREKNSHGRNDGDAQGADRGKLTVTMNSLVALLGGGKEASSDQHRQARQLDRNQESQPRLCA